MAIYRAPIRDMQFVIHELLDAQRCFAELPGGEDASSDIIDSILEEGAKLCENVIFPPRSIWFWVPHHLKKGLYPHYL